MLQRHLNLLLLTVLGALLLAGVSWLVVLRFDDGDVYPAYSSLRSDPLGARVLYEALEELPGVAVERNLNPHDRLRGAEGTTVLLLGLRLRNHDPDGLARRLNGLAQEGARVVVTLSPMDALWLREVEEDEGDDSVEPGGGASQDGGDVRPRDGSLWGVRAVYRDLPEAVEGRGVSPAVVECVGCSTAKTLAWHSPLVFELEKTGWEVVYARDGEAVVVERQQGAGTLVLASDSFVVSNEGLYGDRQPRLLTWLVGPSRRVVFDEFHHGVQAPAGLMALARRYRLLGFFAALGVVAALFVWRALWPFVPAERELGGADVHLGQGSSTALLHLLRRGLGEGELLRACLAVWKRSFSSRVEPAVVSRLDELATAPGEASVGYRRIVRELRSVRWVEPGRGRSS